MGRKSREKRERVVPELVRVDNADCTKWGWKEWVGIICLTIFFYGSIAWTNQLSVDYHERLQREGRNAYQQQQEANKAYVENLFK